MVALENEVTNFRKELSELAASNSALDSKEIASETRPKEVIDVGTVQYARLRSLEDEEKSLWRQCSVQTSSMSSAGVMSEQLQSSLDAFPQSMQAAMDASVSQLKESMVSIETGPLADVDNCSHELDHKVIDRSRHSPNPSGWSTTTSAHFG